jgi:hypothetical protein
MVLWSLGELRRLRLCCVGARGIGNDRCVVATGPTSRPSSAFPPPSFPDVFCANKLHAHMVGGSAGRVAFHYLPKDRGQGCVSFWDTSGRISAGRAASADGAAGPALKSKMHFYAWISPTTITTIDARA